jgi:hypothetical protein
VRKHPKEEEREDQCAGGWIPFITLLDVLGAIISMSLMHPITQEEFERLDPTITHTDLSIQFETSVKWNQWLSPN